MHINLSTSYKNYQDYQSNSYNYQKVCEELTEKVSKELENLIISSDYSIHDTLKVNSTFVEKYSSTMYKIQNSIFNNQFLGGTKKLHLRGQNSLLWNILPISWGESTYDIFQKSNSKLAAYGQKYNENAVPEYTGLLILAKDIDIIPAFSPKIYIENGRQIYGAEFLSEEVGRIRGVMGYGSSFQDRRITQRVGNNPLVVAAISTLGKYNSDVVVLEKDVENMLLKKENVLNLKRARVGLIIKKNSIIKKFQ